MRYRLMWSPQDKAAIQAEIAALRQAGHEEELARVLAWLNAIAEEGPHARAQHIHMQAGGRALHAAWPFGTVAVFYAYESPPTADIYILGFFLDAYLHVGTAAARLSHVP